MKKEVKPQRPPNPLPDIHFRITAEEYRQLQAVAKGLDRSVAYLIAKIVREYLKGQQHYSPEEPEEPEKN